MGPPGSKLTSNNHLVMFVCLLHKLLLFTIPTHLCISILVSGLLLHNCLAPPTPLKSTDTCNFKTVFSLGLVSVLPVHHCKTFLVGIPYGQCCVYRGSGLHLQSTHITKTETDFTLAFLTRGHIYKEALITTKLQI